MGSSAKMLKLAVLSICLFNILPSSEAAPAVEDNDVGLVERMFNSVYSSVFTNYEMAPYQVMTTLANGVEERRYSAATWVCTKSSAAFFWRLFKYIGGENEAQVKFDMTVPVATKTTPGSSLELEMCFFVSQSLAAPPSPPTNPLVVIKNVPERVVFVSRFGGFIKSAAWMG